MNARLTVKKRPAPFDGTVGCPVYGAVLPGNAPTRPIPRPSQGYEAAYGLCSCWCAFRSEFVSAERFFCNSQTVAAASGLREDGWQEPAHFEPGARKREEGQDGFARVK